MPKLVGPRRKFAGNGSDWIIWFRALAYYNINIKWTITQHARVAKFFMRIFKCFVTDHNAHSLFPASHHNNACIRVKFVDCFLLNINNHKVPMAANFFNGHINLMEKIMEQA